ncbi:MAG: cytochrome c3 family protein [Pseudomonadales bacterium]
MRWLAVIAVLLLLFGYGRLARQQQITEAPLLPMTFAHADHIAEPCVTCHHNYVDDNGLRSCLDCHKHDPEVSALIEAQFHGLCRNCHIEKALEGEDSGPHRDCESCHVADNRP